MSKDFSNSLSESNNIDDEDAMRFLGLDQKELADLREYLGKISESKMLDGSSFDGFLDDNSSDKTHDNLDFKIDLEKLKKTFCKYLDSQVNLASDNSNSPFDHIIGNILEELKLDSSAQVDDKQVLGLAGSHEETLTKDIEYNLNS